MGHPLSRAFEGVADEAKNTLDPNKNTMRLWGVLSGLACLLSAVERPSLQSSALGACTPGRAFCLPSWVWYKDRGGLAHTSG